MLLALLLNTALAAAPAPEALLVAPFDPVDATAGLQGAIDSGAKKVRVPDTGKPWLVGPIRLASEQELVFEPGVVVMAKEGAFKGLRESLFTATGVHDVVLRGYGASFVMRKKDYRAPPYEPSEWRHAVAIRSSQRVKVLGLRLASSGGDGVYIGRAEGKTAYSQDVELRDVTAEDHHRQGLSVVSVDGLRVSSSVFKGTTGTDPQAGVDFEPNGPDERIANVVIEDSRFDGNASWGILLALMRLKAGSEPVSVRLTRCGAKDNRAGALRVMQSPVRGRIIIEKPSFAGRMMLEKGGGVAVER